MPVEIATIKEYLLKPEFLQWPVGSVYYQMIRDRAAFMAESTFYLYARLLNLTTLHRRRKPKIIKCGIRAAKPFQVLHVDITELRINDWQKLYISFIVDNFSRAILGRRASLRKTASLTLENLKEVIAKHKLPGFTLLVDDGSENKGCVKEFVKNTDLNIDLQIAQCDISFSNSMVEAVFRTLKLYYWPPGFEGTPEKANEILEKCINNYNILRPHRSHKGLTPYEALKIDVIDRNEIIPVHEIRNAATRRIAENRNSDCRDCEDE